MNFSAIWTILLRLFLFIMHIGSFHWWKPFFFFLLLAPITSLLYYLSKYTFSLMVMHFIWPFYLTFVSLCQMAGFMYNSITHRCSGRSIRLHKLVVQSVYGFAIKHIYSFGSPQGRRRMKHGPGWSVKPWSQSPKVLEASASKPLILMTQGLFTY